MTEIYQLPQGKITIDFCNKNLSTGFLELDPDQALEKHNRPVDEELMQMQGSCVMELFDNNGLVKKVVLNEGEKLTISANQYHIHSNNSDRKSITSWKFKGNIISVIENIKNNFKKMS